ncbi:MAG: phosphatidate cytidylyltransferase [Steroidobacteraceae bacterium]
MLAQRVATAVVLVLLLWVALFLLPPSLGAAALGVVTLAGAWEWAALAHLTSVASRLAYVGLVFLTMLITWTWVSSQPWALEMVMAVAVGWWLVALAWILLAPRRGSRWLAALAGLLALVPMWVAMTQLLLWGTLAREWLIFGLAIAWGADVGAYAAGRRFGRLRLAPAVRPNKTWEGALGGALVALAIAWLGATWFAVPLAILLPLGTAVFCASVIGDLTESLFKRQSGLKDSGRLLPGHGGVLDRIDSVTAALPVLVLGLSLLRVLA